MIKIYEAKQDIERLYDHINDSKSVETFLNIRKRLKSPYNDIYYWLKRDPLDFIGYIDTHKDSNTKLKRDIKGKGAELIYSDKDWKVYHITSYEASKYYGRGTKWCISGSDEYEDGSCGYDYFINYLYDYDDGRFGESDFYFYINRDGSKYALRLGKRGKYEIYDSNDNGIDTIPNAPIISGLPNLN